MDLDDLRRELRTRAADPGSTPMPDRLAGVRGKVRAARRRKAAAAGAAALASVSVLGVAWAQTLDGGDQVADAKLVSFPEQLNGDLLIDEHYNESGTSQLTWSVTLDGLDVVPRVTCALPSDADLPSTSERVMVVWNAGGTTVSTECASVLPGDVQPAGPTTRGAWRDSGIESGEPFEVEMSLKQGAESIDVEGARFGVGLYQRTGTRQHSDGVELPEVVDVEGEHYRLLDDYFETLPLVEADQRRLRLDLPETSDPVAVAYGWQSDVPAASYEVLQDGEPWRSGYGGRLEGPELIEGGTVQSLTLKVRGSSSDGVLALAVYELDS
ncbi:MAG TPA: hypothetical protein VEX15_01560 [Nocardioidaceae bacterium]|nr:hypothetical protein [Nocardioidaceae bacterium]